MNAVNCKYAAEVFQLMSTFGENQNTNIRVVLLKPPPESLANSTHISVKHFSKDAIRYSLRHLFLFCSPLCYPPHHEDKYYPIYRLPLRCYCWGELVWLAWHNYDRNHERRNPAQEWIRQLLCRNERKAWQCSLTFCALAAKRSVTQALRYCSLVQTGFPGRLGKPGFHIRNVLRGGVEWFSGKIYLEE